MADEIFQYFQQMDTAFTCKGKRTVIVLGRDNNNDEFEIDDLSFLQTKMLYDVTRVATTYTELNVCAQAIKQAH